MKILVTGAAGFVASHVADAYLSAGHEVVILDNLSRGAEKNVNPKARFYRCDICEREAIEEVFQLEKPAIVNHHAAQMDVRRGVREPLFDAQVNILGSLNLMEAALATGAKRFIYIASAGAGYGEPKQRLVPEDYPINPITPYGISKHTVEHYLFTFHFLYGLEYVVLRYGNVYGPRQSSQGEAGVFAIFCEQMLAGVQPVIYGDGTKVRDYVYISDVAAANVAALERGSNEIFNISTGVETTDLEVFQLVRELLGREVEPKYVARRPGEIDRICLDISKAARLLGWVPGVSLAEGARRTVNYFREAATATKSASIAG
ncbi:MAG TPA: NAD-dependent epimerase/dehydratase family protein [Candidatus Polarisedimenticolia bacterium]|nr:NAD-dependent epimerase/dehydratase family protein [Candidatus Polarisedimenticolia bacterium]